MGNAKFDLIWASYGEWVLNIMTLWLRPFYRQIIKTKVGRKIVYKLGNVDCTGDLITGFYSFFIYSFIVTCAITLEISHGLGLSEELYTVINRVLVALIFLGTVYILTRVDFRWSNYGKISLKEKRRNRNDLYLWFDNAEDFCKYHDGFFRKEKLVHRMLLLHLSKQKE